MEPKDLVKAHHQAAGHDGALMNKDGSLFIKPTVQQELDFYVQIQQREEKKDAEMTLAEWMPLFLGSLSEGEVVNDSEQKYAVLENLLYGMNKPNIVDIKLGSILYDDNATESKKQRLDKVKSETTSGSLGFRICGMKMHSMTAPDYWHDYTESAEEGYTFFNKMFGRSLTADNVAQALDLFLSQNALSKDRRALLVENFKLRLQLLYNTLLDEEVEMRSCSLLLVYENDVHRWDALNDHDEIVREPQMLDSDDESDDEEPQHAPLSLLSLIDFAHSKLTPGAGYDENVVNGVESLIKIFDKL